MATATFAKALSYVLVYEGGKVDDPRDPGGRTNQGVIQKTYDAFRRRSDKPARDVYLMDAAERDAIYRRQYWDAIAGDALPKGIDIIVFDGAVNSGPLQSAKWLQRALGVRADGHIGLQTIEAANKHTDHDLLIEEIRDQRMAFLQRLRHWNTYRRGWTTRVAHVTKVSQIIASGSKGAPPAPQFFYGGNAKAETEDGYQFDGTLVADGMTGAGTTTAVLTQAAYTLSPFTDNPNVQTLVIVLTLAGVALAVGGGLWSFVARLRNKDRREALGEGY